jgi:L-ascorbate metabolism protein UlaG (beta-lactamase superfamily)
MLNTSWWIVLVFMLVATVLMVIPRYGRPVEAAEVLTMLTKSGETLRVTPLGHGTIMLEYAGQVIHIDPYSQVADYSRLAKADQIWITHEHSDHLDLAAIRKIEKDDTVFVVNQASASSLSKQRTVVMKNGDKTTVNGVEIMAVPAYNTKRERSPGVKFHPMGVGNGYVASLGGFRLYVAGDTEETPEMAALTEIDLAFLPCNLPYTMTPEEVAQAVAKFKPKTLVPYHQSRSDISIVVKLLEGSGIQVVVLPLP